MAEKTQAQKAKEALDLANKAKENPAADKAAADKAAADKAAADKAAADKAAADKAAADKAAADDASGVKPDGDGFLNPFSEGVTYADFVKAKGKKTVENYCKGKLEKSQIAWISEEIKHYEKNNK